MRGVAQRVVSCYCLGGKKTIIWKGGERVETVTQKSPSVLDRLFEPVPETPAEELGHYDPDTQTWSHRDARLMSPIKTNKER